ncbi:hypothetical protein AAE485_15105 (plasmid) [Acidithiobacillus ferriphilus]|uniref:hypothetical protein n=1 Tax=Acidithiobacillus TaxID=119977 RepID=UPI0034E48D93
MLAVDGESVDVEGYFICFDEHDGIVWYTNCYGVDGAITNTEPRDEAKKSFIVHQERAGRPGLWPNTVITGDR